jgi:hypothetical protein
MTTSAPTPPAAELQMDEQQLDEQLLKVLGPGAPQTEEISPQDLVEFGVSYRHDWGSRNGWWILNLTSGLFTANTRAFVSASEGPTANGGKFIGSARYLIYNVAPENGVVSIRIFIDWPSPIGVVVDYLFVNP